MRVDGEVWGLFRGWGGFMVSACEGDTLPSTIISLQFSVESFEIPEAEMPFPRTPSMHSCVSVESCENFISTGCFYQWRCPEMRS